MQEGAAPKLSAAPAGQTVGSSSPAESTARTAQASPGLEFPRYFTLAGQDPFDQVDWDFRDAVIGNEKGHVVFEQRGVEIPKSWSQQATNIVVSKYFRGHVGAPERERSVKQLIGRVVDTITEWARRQKYFASASALSAFSDDLKHLLVHQQAAFNSPVWFNCGFEKAPQCSACFINSVDDTMESILGLARTEGMLFKFGSGTGSNLSAIRSSKELLAGGGTASGPVSFMKGFDAFAGVIKSGGKTRRAAKMVILNADHPDVVEFINCKVEEEKKAWALIDAGYDGSFTGTAYGSVFFQNSNNSVRVTDEFMRAVLDDGLWQTHAVTTDEVMDTYRARDLMRLIAEGTWVCGDPGMQFDTTVNEWHTSPNTARINASNPCSEYMFLDDSACNLSSLNLMTFVREDGEFDVEAFRAACRTLITAQEILVDNSSYPTKAIEKNSHAFRPLGLGYANLGALLMSRGLPYDSDAGRDYAGAITAVMTGEAYAQSARIARDQGGPFAGYDINREPFLRVMRKHRDAIKDINTKNVPADLYNAAKQAWDDAVVLGEDFGYRNAQATVLAPTGTIGFMMDCDTTGVEPDIALVKYKKLVGGGMMKIVNQTVPMALSKLGYTASQIEDIVKFIDEQETIEGAPHLLERDLPVFDCAFKASKGERSIHFMGHIKMMGATQPFISGAISKTVNVPKNASVEDIELAYIESWRLGAKAISIYRDGSKRTQPLNTSKDATHEAKDVNKDAVAAAVASALANRAPVRRKLPDERQAITHKFDISGHEGYVTVGLFEDGQPGEIFLVMAKEGSTISGFADAFAQAISYALQYGVPLQALVDKFSHVRFEPSGMTKNPDVRFAKSIVDYIFRWMASKFLSPEAQFRAGVNNRDEASYGEAEVPAPKVVVTTTAKVSATGAIVPSLSTIQNQEDAPPCTTCGSIMVRSGACYKCSNCGTTSGCA
jgi:ribonucleoside-diphosphate reductase alpha chain